MRVLFLAPEVVPYSKTGGLADVCAALPAALARRGHEVKVVTPLYGQVNRAGLRGLEKSVQLKFPFGTHEAQLHSAKPSKLHEVIFLEHAGFYGRSALYGEGAGDYPDNHRRFG